MEALKYFVTAVSGYVYGSVSFSILISHLLHSDIRGRGSGNAGATNMARSYGLGAGLETMAGDMIKTALGLLCGLFILGQPGVMTAGITCLLGHCFPVFYDFKGGKGVSAAAMVTLFIHPLLAAVLLAVFLAAAFLSRKVSVGSLCAATALLVCSLLWELPVWYRVLGCFTAVLLAVRHIPNIKRLIKGQEPDFRAAGK